MSVKEYEKLANSSVYKPPSHSNHDELERKYWKTLSFCPPIYGCDVPDSITDQEQEAWNIRDLKTILNYVNEDYNQQLKGVTTPYLYFGMWKATFSWHVEDMDLHSVNYLHFGAPKTWYCVPPQYGYLLEAAARELFPDVASWCSNFMRHKTCLISPNILDKLGVPYQKVVQEERNAIIVFPYAYHSGFNHGFNIAESTNFALERWIEYGKRARQCDCQRSRVMFSMDTFVKKYQPELWESWQKGTDIKPHPEDPPEVVAEFQLRISNPKKYATMKQERFLKRNVRYKNRMKSHVTCPTPDQKETNSVHNDSSQETKTYHVYQHHEYLNVKVTVDPDTMKILGDGRDLLEKFMDAENIDIKELIESSLLIKIGDKTTTEIVATGSSNKLKYPASTKMPVHIYRHFELDIEARVNSKTLDLDGYQSEKLNKYLKNEKNIKQLISLGIFKYSNEEHTQTENLKYVSNSNVTDNLTVRKDETEESRMGTLEQNTIDRTMELVDLISGHIYKDLTSNEIVTYLPKCQKFVGTITERMIHLFQGKCIDDLVEEGKLVKLGERRLCPDEALTLIQQKVHLNRTTLNIRLGNGEENFKVDVATHHAISDRVVFTVSSKATDSTKYEEAIKALENNPIRNLLDENILVQDPNLGSSNNRKLYYAKSDMLFAALQHRCKIVKCAKHINETKIISSTTKTSNETGCKCTLTGLLPLRNSLLGTKTKTGAKSVIIRIIEYSNTVTIENRLCEEFYIVKDCSLPFDIKTEEFESEDEFEKEFNQDLEVGKKSSAELLNDGIQTRRKRKGRDIDDIRGPYNSEEDEVDVPNLNSDDSNGSADESSDDPDYMKSKSYQWKSKRAAKKKQKKLIPTALRVGVPGFVLEKRRDSEELRSPIKVKRSTNRILDTSLLSTATALINYFEDDENLDEDFNLIFYSKDLARKLEQEPSKLLDVLKIFKEFQIVTRVMKKPQDREKPRYEWNGIEMSNINAVLVQIYLGEIDANAEENDQGYLWKVCVDVLKHFTRSRKVIF